MFLGTVLSVLAGKAAPRLCKRGLARWAPSLAEVSARLCANDILEVCLYHQ